MFELTQNANRQQQQTLELQRLRIEREKLYAIYETIHPKVKPALIAGLLTRLCLAIMYMSHGDLITY